MEESGVIIGALIIILSETSLTLLSSQINAGGFQVISGASYNTNR